MATVYIVRTEYYDYDGGYTVINAVFTDKETAELYSEMEKTLSKPDGIFVEEHELDRVQDKWHHITVRMKRDGKVINTEHFLSTKGREDVYDKKIFERRRLKATVQTYDELYAIKVVNERRVALLSGSEWPTL